MLTIMCLPPFEEITQQRETGLYFTISTPERQGGIMEKVNFLLPRILLFWNEKKKQFRRDQRALEVIRLLLYQFPRFDHTLVNFIITLKERL